MRHVQSLWYSEACITTGEHTCACKVDNCCSCCLQASLRGSNSVAWICACKDAVLAIFLYTMQYGMAAIILCMSIQSLISQCGVWLLCVWCPLAGVSPSQSKTSFEHRSVPASCMLVFVQCQQTLSKHPTLCLCLATY